MSSLQQLKKDALDRRAQFATTLLDIRSRLTLPGLADEALRLFDPHFTRLPPRVFGNETSPTTCCKRTGGRGLAVQTSAAKKSPQSQKHKRLIA